MKSSSDDKARVVAVDVSDHQDAAALGKDVHASSGPNIPRLPLGLAFCYSDAVSILCRDLNIHSRVEKSMHALEPSLSLVRFCKIDYFIHKNALCCIPNYRISDGRRKSIKPTSPATLCCPNVSIICITNGLHGVVISHIVENFIGSTLLE